MIRLAAAVLALAALPATAADWAAIPERSSLAFHGTYQGEAFDGVFHRFSPSVRYDAADPAAIAIEARIEMGSVDTQNEERDGTLATPEFFGSEQFPAATFRAHDCAAAEAGHWRCKAELTIRDKTRPIDFAFAWTGTGSEATLTAQVELDRLAFDVGTGDWTDTELIGRTVKVDVKLALKPAT
jgi:polyisoprenoid-binding protein YceI